MSDTAGLRKLAEAATAGPWYVYDPNEGIWPPRPCWSIANDAFHNPPADGEGPWPAFNAIIETGDAADAAYLAALDPGTVLDLLDRLDRLDAYAAMRCVGDHSHDGEQGDICVYVPAADYERYRQQHPLPNPAS